MKRAVSTILIFQKLAVDRSFLLESAFEIALPNPCIGKREPLI